MSELKQFKLPDVGEGLTEADIVRWLVQPGDQVAINQIVVEIETAKSLVELPSPFEGVVKDLLVPEGTTADVGTPILSVSVGADAGGADAGIATGAPAPSAEISAPPAEGAVEPGLHGSPAPKEKEERQAVLVGYGVKLGATKRRTRKPAAAGAVSPAAASPGSAPEPAASPGAAAAGSGTAAGLGMGLSAGVASAAAARVRAAREPGVPSRPDGAPADAATLAVLAKPPVRKLAKDLGVSLTGLTGSGPAGSITRDDVQAAASGAGAEPAATTQAAATAAPAGLPSPAVGRLASLPREERIAIRGVRKHTAAAV
ncbi:MAG TPA: biotin/lipoyl-containing protein, partial [Streptosporangiaceae bacterium]